MDKTYKEMSFPQLGIGMMLPVIWISMWIILPEYDIWPMVAFTVFLAHRTWQLPPSYRMPIFMHICCAGILTILIIILMGQTNEIELFLSIILAALSLNLLIKDKS